MFIISIILLILLFVIKLIKVIQSGKIMTHHSKCKKNNKDSLEKSKKFENNIEKKSNIHEPISEVITQEYSRLVKSVNSINQKYDQSIEALKKWEKDEKTKLNELQKKMDEKFSCQMIDADDIKFQLSIENIENEMAKRNEDQREKDKQLQDRINSILKKR